MILTLPLVVLLIGTVSTIFYHPTFEHLPRGERLERIKRSSNYRDEKSHNIHFTPTTTTKEGGVQVFWDFFFGKQPDLKPHKSLLTVKADLLHLDRNEDLVTWFGHSFYLIQNGGKRLLTDPALTDRFPASLVSQPSESTDLYKPEDIPDTGFLIITHGYWDHLDYCTVKRLKDCTEAIICGLGVGEYLECQGFSLEHTVEIDWCGSYRINNNCQVYCLLARHFSNRLLENT